MFVTTDKPVPLISRVVAFEAPDIEATLIMPPIPGDEDDDEDKDNGITGDGSIGRTSTSLSELGSTCDVTVANIGEMDMKITMEQKPMTSEVISEEKSARVSEKGSPDSDIPTVEISDSSPVKELRTGSFGSVDSSIEPQRQDGASKASIGGPPGAVVVTEEVSMKRCSSLSHSQQPSDSPTIVSQSQWRKSQEVLTTSQSASGSPVFRNIDVSHPPRSSSQSDLARVHHTQMSFSSLQQLESNSSKASSLTSLDESADLDIISLSSDSSEGFVMAVKTDGQSLGSSQGAETDSDIGKCLIKASIHLC